MNKIKIKFDDSMIHVTYDQGAPVPDIIEAMASALVTICRDRGYSVEKATGEFIDEAELYNVDARETLFNLGDDDV